MTEQSQKAEDAKAEDKYTTIGIIVLGRHANAPPKPDGSGSQDMLTPEAFPATHRKAKGDLEAYVSQAGVTPDQTFSRSSGKKRTLQTGLDYLAGALSLPEPKDASDLEKLASGDLAKADVQEDKRLSPEGYKGDLEALKKDGEQVYMRNWASNPNATSYPNGKEVTPYVQVLENSQAVLIDAIAEIARGKKLGVLTAHAGNIEPILAVAANPEIVAQARAYKPGKEPFKVYDGISDFFEKGEAAYLIILGDKEGKPVGAVLQRGKQQAEVDLRKLFTPQAEQKPEGKKA